MRVSKIYYSEFVELGRRKLNRNSIYIMSMLWRCIDYQLDGVRENYNGDRDRMIDDLNRFLMKEMADGNYRNTLYRP